MGTVLTEQSLELINALQIAPRVPWNRLSDILGATPITLSQRWSEIRARGQAWVTAAASGAARGSAIAFVEVDCGMDRMGDLGQIFVQTPEIVSVERLSQGATFGLTVIEDDLGDLATRSLDAITQHAGVVSVQVSACIALHHGAHLWRLDHLDPGQMDALRAINREMSATDPTIALGPESPPIIRMLQRDGRCTAADVSRRLGLSPATVRRRLAAVLHSGAIFLRTEVAQSHSGWPVNVQWHARLLAGEHAAAAARLTALNPRLVVSCTGGSNLVVTFWLRSLNDVLATEHAIEKAVPGITLVQSRVLIRALKRHGWVLRPDGTTTGAFVSVPQ